MAEVEEKVTDILWEEMRIFAIEQQQCLYESLPDCTIYESDERKYLEQNIGYAIYGPPQNTKDANTTESSCYYKAENMNDTDVTDTVHYNKEAKEVIEKIYKKICTCAVENNDSQPILVGIIYNMTFRTKTNVTPKKKEAKKETKMEAKKDTKTVAKKETKTEAKKETKTETKEVKKYEELFIVLSTPIFKINKSMQKNFETSIIETQDEIWCTDRTGRAYKMSTTKTQDEIWYIDQTGRAYKTSTTETKDEIWYIDITGRVYKSWKDYIENNTLPQCTMVLPKDGFYQSNLEYPVIDDCSTVWLEIKDSPACTLKAKIKNGIDIASTVVGYGTIGLGVASMFTPLAPVVMISGLAATGVSSAWSLARNTEQLMDRSTHEESIRVFDKEAFPHYLGIAGTTFGLGVIGGSAILSKIAARGMTVNTLTKVAFNTVLSGNLVLNGIGVAYQGYRMYDKYKKEKTIDFVDTLNLATHLMFFYGSVVKVQFANDIIESTQGRIMDDYRETLSTKRLRNKYNRVVRKAANNNTCKMSENAEVIRHINYRQQLVSDKSVINSATNGSSRKLDNTSRNFVWSLDHGRLIVNGITLLDPVEYVIRLVKLGIFIATDQNDASHSQNYANDSTTDKLATVLRELLYSKLYVSDDCPASKKLPIVADFEPLLMEMSSMRIDEDHLRMLFDITVKLWKCSKDMDDFLFQIFNFIWQYCKENLKQWGFSICTQSTSGTKLLQRIIRAVFEAIDEFLTNLQGAFAMYIKSNLNR